MLYALRGLWALLLFTGCSGSEIGTLPDGRERAAVHPEADAAVADAFVAPGDAIGLADAFCPALPQGGAGDGGLLQQWCAAGQGNPAPCPATKPVPGDMCDAPGLQCAYTPGESFYLTETCDADGLSWRENLHVCGADCTLFPGGMVKLQAPACGSEPAVGCEGTTGTDRERADSVLRAAMECCGIGENAVTALISDSCITHWNSALSLSESQIECLSNAFGGRRLACAANLTCIEAERSTVR